MSLLLDALKKAEEAKRRREAGLAAAGSTPAPAPADMSQTALPELSLQAPEPAVAAEATEPALAEPLAPEALTFTLEPVNSPASAAPGTDLADDATLPTLEMVVEPAPLAAAEPADAPLTDPVTEQIDHSAQPSLMLAPTPAPGQVSPATDAATPPASTATTAQETASTTVTEPAATPRPTVEAPTPTPAATAPTTRRDSPLSLSPEATRQLFDSKRPDPGQSSRSKRMALILVLCLVIGLAGAGWLWWQWQSTQQGSMMVLAPPPDPAATPTEAGATPADPANATLPVTDPGAAKPVPAPGAPATVAAPGPVASSAPATAPMSPPAPPALPVQPREGDRARVVEIPHDVAAPDVRFVREAQDNAVPRNLQLAYEAFQQGDYPRAAELYRQHLRQDSKSRDALLGLAAVAVQRQQFDEARNLYRRVLADNPRDELAQAALTSLSSSNDPDAAEGQLRTQMQQSPRPETATSLANLLARQGRWREAQEFYFQAHGAAPEDPDYAYNLAIALDALGEPRLAADYYRKALALAARKPAGFDTAAAQRRLAKLGGE